MKRVRLRDYSYSLVIQDGRLEHKIFSLVGNCGKKENEYYIIAENCVLPVHEGYGNDRPNDTILQHIPTGLIVFTQERFTEAAFEYCPHCGEAIKEIEYE